MKIIFEPMDISTDDIVRTIVNLSEWQVNREHEIAENIFEVYNRAISDGACDFSSAEEQLEWEATNTGNFTNPKPALLPSQIWRLVRFHTIHLYWNHDRSATIAEVQGEAAWDGEAGITMRLYNGNDYRHR